MVEATPVGLAESAAATAPNLPDILLWAIPGFIILVLAEIIYGRLTRKTSYEPRDTFTSLFMGTGSNAAGILLGGVAGGYFLWLQQYAIFDIGWAWWVWVAVIFLDDFIYYWAHRLGHRVRWWWAAHVIHHSSQHYNLSTALRQTWTGTFTLQFFFLYTWPVLFGVPLAMIAFVHAVNLIYQFWIHTEAIRRFPPWFEAVMNTPSHHRVHHSTNPEYLDSNYAGMFIIWDKMFGSFAPERDDEPCRYGIVKNLGTFNPLTVAFHEWAGMFRDIVSARSLGDAVRYVVAPPGWTPDGSRETTAMIKAKHRAATAGTTPATDDAQPNAPTPAASPAE